MPERLFFRTRCIVCTVWVKKPLRTCGNFSKRLGIFQPNFMCLLCVPIYARQILIQLSPTVTKLCHIKCDNPACVLVDGGHFEYMVVALNMA